MKIKIMGNSFAVKSALTMADWIKLNRFKKKVVLNDEKGDEYFRVSATVEASTGCVASCGVMYDTIIDDVAAVVMLTDCADEIATKEFIKTELAETLTNLASAEQLALELLDDVDARSVEIDEMIEG